MNPCSKSLLDSIIDYAGLFPPAGLSMNDAFSRFVHHHQSGDGWMMARFVCPASRLEELEGFLPKSEGLQPAVNIAVLGRGGATLEEFLESVDHDDAKIRSFLARTMGRATADVFEVRLPAAGGVAVAVEKAWRRLTNGGSTPMSPYFEVSLLDDWRPRLPAAAAAVRDTDRSAGRPQRVGLKIRCGGLDAGAIPEPVAVAAAIATCHSVEVPLKATQGLHHPFRHFDKILGAEVHGFLNLFTASIMAHTHDIPVTRLTEIVAETDPQAFSIEADRLAWRDLEATAEQVASARNGVLTTFGSCSFSEPRDDLEALHLFDH